MFTWINLGQTGVRDRLTLWAGVTLCNTRHEFISVFLKVPIRCRAITGQYLLTIFSVVVMCNHCLVVVVVVVVVVVCCGGGR